MGTNMATRFFLTLWLTNERAYWAQATYKLCLWCLSMQNFDVARHRLLPRTVEGLVQAIINPFKSRPSRRLHTRPSSGCCLTLLTDFLHSLSLAQLLVELQALRGLHAMLLKYPEQMAASPAVLGVWVKPITSRLRSSDRATREQARLLLQEAARHQSSWTAEMTDHIQDYVGEYVLPAMKTLVDRDKHVEALHMWTLTVSLMRRALVEDLTVLNAVLYVPENAMGHTDAAVRLIGLQAWSHLVDAFCATDYWLFKKSVVQLLVQPVVVTLEVEPMHNIVHAAFLCWKKLVDAAVRAFNAHYHDAHSVEDAQQDALKWKRWLNEIVRVPISTILVSQARVQARNEENRVNNDVAERGDDEETKPFLVMAASVWETESTDVKPGGREDESEAGTEDVSAAMKTGRDPANTSTSIDGAYDTDVSVIGSNAIGLAFLLPDIFAAVQTFIGISEVADASRLLTKQRARELVVATWSGFCQRIWTLKTPDDKPDKLRLRLARLCLDFALGASSSSPNTNSSSSQKTATAFPIEWQVSLIAPLLIMAPTSDVVTALLLHPKSRVHNCVAARLTALQESHPACGAVVRRFFALDNTTDGRLDMALKDNVLLTLMMHLMLESAVAIDAKSNPSLPEVVHFVVSVCQLCRFLLNTASSTGEVSSQTSGWRRVVGFVNRWVKAADVLASSEKEDQLDSQAWHGFIELCMSATEEGEDTERRAATVASSTTSSLAEKLVRVAASDKPAPASKDDDTDSFSALEAKKDLPIPGTPDASSTPCLVRGSLPVAVSTTFTTPRGSSSASLGAPAGPTPAVEERPEPAPHPSPEQAKQMKEAAATSLLKATSHDPQRRTPQPDQQMRASVVASADVPPTTASTSAVFGSPRQQGTSKTNTSNQGIYPTLAKCTESISLVYRHFPLPFRPFFSFYKIKTIGDLSSTPAAKVKTFGIKDPVETVMRALEEYDARRSRSSTSASAPNSPFRQRLLLSPPSRQSAVANAAPTTPSRRSPSPRRSAPGKRPAGHMHHHFVSPLRTESPHRKRACRLLDELNNDVDGSTSSRKQQPGDEAPVDPKLADRVPFCLPTGEGDATRITRPVEESQDRGGQAASHSKDEEEEADDKMSTYMLKLLQHLRRSAYYVDTIAAEEESLQSDAGLRTDAVKMDGVLGDFQEAHELVATLSRQLHVVAEASARRCRRTLDRTDAGAKPSGA